MDEGAREGLLHEDQRDDEGSPHHDAARGMRDMPTSSQGVSDDGIRRCQSDSAMVTGKMKRTASDDDGFKLLELQQKVYRIVWNYFVCMIILNSILAGSFLVLLMWLAVDMSAVQAGLSFFLAFIPELGVLISCLLPIPFVLLTPTEHCGIDPLMVGNHSVANDCIVDFVDRMKKLGLAIGGMLLIKLMVANVLNAVVMGRNRVLAGAIGKGEVSETHGVLVLFAVVFFSKVWGTVGMLISVPVISIVRLTINIGLERGRVKAKQFAKQKSGEELDKGVKLDAQHYLLRKPSQQLRVSSAGAVTASQSAREETRWRRSATSAV